MAESPPYPQLVNEFSGGVQDRLTAITELAADGGLEQAIAVMADAISAGGVIHAFGTGHSEAFAMEIAGRAGGLIPTNKIALRDVVLNGSFDGAVLTASELERNPDIADHLWASAPVDEQDAFIIASNSGVNNSIIGMALLVKRAGHKLIAVTSLEHTMKVQPKHASGKRLCDLADVVIDNRAPYGDATLELAGGIPVGSVSSITCAYIGQLLTVGVAHRLGADGAVPPLYLSANIPGGDEHNHALEAAYEGKITRGL